MGENSLEKVQTLQKAGSKTLVLADNWHLLTTYVGLEQ